MTVFLLLLPPVHAQTDKGVKNDSGKVWIVRYHEDNPNKHGHIAMKLHVALGTGGAKSLQGELSRYDSKTGTKYKLCADGGTVSLIGGISKHPGTGSKRRREEFTLVGTYVDAADTPHVVTVRGFHYTGKAKKDVPATGGHPAIVDRDDDQILVSVVDKPMTTALLRKPYGDGEPCDEQPPDEDVLMEDAPADPPDYDPDS